MKTQNKLSKLMSITISAIMLIVISVCWGVSPATAQETPEATAAVFGSIGVAVGQKVRINVVNARPADSVFPSDPVTPVRVEMRILDQAGNTLARNRTRISPGQTTEIEFNPNLSPRGINRMQISAIVIINHPRERYGSKFITSTLEIINNDTGISSLFTFPGSILMFNPQPEPPAVF